MSDKNYSETQRTVNTRNINRMLFCCKKKPIRLEKLNQKQQQ